MWEEVEDVGEAGVGAEENGGEEEAEEGGWNGRQGSWKQRTLDGRKQQRDCRGVEEGAVVKCGFQNDLLSMMTSA